MGIRPQKVHCNPAELGSVQKREDRSHVREQVRLWAQLLYYTRVVDAIIMEGLFENPFEGGVNGTLFFIENLLLELGFFFNWLFENLLNGFPSNFF